MATSWTPRCALLAIGLAACGDAPTAPDDDTPPVQTVLLHFAASGENRLWDTDGTAAGELSAETRGLVPLGAHAGERVIAFLHGDAIVLTTLDRPWALDTILRPAPQSHSLVAFSPLGDLAALVTYGPVQGVIVFDRVNRLLDTLSYGAVVPVLPPVFSPDGARLVLFGLNELSLLATIIPRVGGEPRTIPLPVSRFLNRPVFGWPRWIGTGVRMAFLRRATDGPDTLLIGDVFPDDPELRLIEAFRSVLAPSGDSTVGLEFDLPSTYALTTDGRAVILGAVPVGGVSAHAVYYAAEGFGPVRRVVDSAGQYPVYPLFVRE